MAHEAELNRLNALLREESAARDADRQRFLQQLDDGNRLADEEKQQLKTQLLHAQDLHAIESSRLAALHAGELEAAQRNAQDAQRRFEHEVTDLKSEHQLLLAAAQRQAQESAAQWSAARAALEREYQDDVEALKAQLNKLKQELSGARGDHASAMRAFEEERLQIGRQFDAQVRSGLAAGHVNTLHSLFACS